MSKKIVSFFLAIMIGLSSSPFPVYAAGGEKAFEHYEEAKKATRADGRWREELDVTIDRVHRARKVKKPSGTCSNCRCF